MVWAGACRGSGVEASAGGSLCFGPVLVVCGGCRSVVYFLGVCWLGLSWLWLGLCSWVLFGCSWWFPYRPNMCVPVCFSSRQAFGSGWGLGVQLFQTVVAFGWARVRFFWCLFPSQTWSMVVFFLPQLVSWFRRLACGGGNPGRLFRSLVQQHCLVVVFFFVCVVFFSGLLGGVVCLRDGWIVDVEV